MEEKIIKVKPERAKIINILNTLLFLYIDQTIKSWLSLNSAKIYSKKIHFDKFFCSFRDQYKLSKIQHIMKLFVI